MKAPIPAAGPDLSVIIVSWNTRDLLVQCLLSVLGDAGPSAEIIVVDNASSDGSAEAAESLSDRIRVVRNSANTGFARANNIGIRQSRGQTLALVNSDVIVRPGCFSAMLAYLETQGQVGMLGPKILWPDGKTVQRSCMAFPTVWNMLCRALGLDSLFPRTRMFGDFLMTFWPHDTLREVEVINGCFWMIRRSAMDRVGLLDEDFFMYAEDIDWCKRFHNAGWKVVFYPEAEAVHYGGASSAAMPVRFYLEKQKANFQYWRKHHSLPSTFAYYVIMLMHEAIRVAAYSLLAWKKRGPAHFQPVLKVKRSLACIRRVSRESLRPPVRSVERPVVRRSEQEVI